MSLFRSLSKLSLTTVALLVLSSLPVPGDELMGFGYSMNNGARPLLKLNPADGQLGQSVTTTFSPQRVGNDVVDLGVAYGDGGIWVLGYSANLGPRPLYKVNPADGTVLQTVSTVLRPEGLGHDFITRSLAYGDGYIWGLGYLALKPTRPLYKLDPKTGQIAQTIMTTINSAGVGNDLAKIGLAYGDGFLWGFGYAVNGARPLYKINPKDGAIAQTLTSNFNAGTPTTDVATLGLAHGAGHLWALGQSVNNGMRPLYKISTATGQTVQTITTALKASAFGGDMAVLGLAFVSGK